MTGYDVVTLGEVLVELSSVTPFRTSHDVRLSYSGDALNAAAAAAAAGARAALLTRVGDDELGLGLIDRVRELGVEDSLIHRVPGPNGVYFVHADPAGIHEFVYMRRSSAASTLAPADAAGAGLEQARALVVTGITQAISETAAATVEAAAQIVSTAGGLVVYDPNFRPRLTTPAAAMDAFRRIAPHVALVTPSFPGDGSALFGAADPVETIEACLDLGARAVAVTCGASGVVLHDGARLIRLPALPAPVVVDATGAGDVFAGTVAARVAAGDDLETAVRLGTSAASLSVAGQGGTGYLAPLQTVREHLAAHGTTSAAPCAEPA